MPAKMVTDREKATRALWATGETYADEVAAAHRRRYAPVLAPGETMPDIALVQRLSIREVADKCRALSAAERADAACQRQLAGLRARRQEATATLRGMLVAVRRLYEGHPRRAVRRGGRSLLGFAGRTPEQPNVLARQAAATIVHLRHLAAHPTPMPPTAQWINPAAWADKLAPAHATLARCLVDLEHARAAAISTQGAKRRAMQAFDHAYSTAVRELACLYALVGLPQRATALPPARLRRDAQRSAARATKEAAPAHHPPAAQPAESALADALDVGNGAGDASEGVLRVGNGAGDASEDVLRVGNGAGDASEGVLRVGNGAGDASEDELRVGNGAGDASEDELRVRPGAAPRFNRMQRRRRFVRAAPHPILAPRLASPRHVSTHRRRARPGPVALNRAN